MFYIKVIFASLILLGVYQIGYYNGAMREMSKLAKKVNDLIEKLEG